MRLYALSLVGMLGVGACAQIAGFEDLTARNPDGEQGGTASGASTAGASGSASGKPGAGGSASGGASGTSGTSSTEAGAGEPPTEGGAGPGSGNAGAASGSGGAPITAGAGGSAGSGGSPVIGACNVNLLRNGDFDAGATEWQQDSEAPGITEVADLIIRDDNQALLAAKVAPKSGHYLGWLGGVLDKDEGTLTRLQQTVQIPSKVSKLVVSGWLHIETSEPVVAESFDHFELGLLDDGDGQWLLRTWWLDAAEGKPAPAFDTWFSFSEELPESSWLDQIRGRTLTFIVDAQADTTFVTSFWVDSLSLVATCPR